MPGAGSGVGDGRGGIDRTIDGVVFGAGWREHDAATPNDASSAAAMRDRPSSGFEVMYDKVAHATPGRVKALFADLPSAEVTRYELPQLAALNFVITGALRGGVTRSLALDAHGKSLSSLLLTLEIPDETDGR